MRALIAALLLAGCVGQPPKVVPLVEDESDEPQSKRGQDSRPVPLVLPDFSDLPF